MPRPLSSLLVPLMLPLIGGCAYSVEAWWTDLARAHCTCEFSDDRRATCVDEYIADVYEQTPEWNTCRDAAAPVERDDVRAWRRQYTENCDQRELASPQPADPTWAESCNQ